MNKIMRLVNGCGREMGNNKSTWSGPNHVQTAGWLREHADRGEVSVQHVLHHWHATQLS